MTVSSEVPGPGGSSVYDDAWKMASASVFSGTGVLCKDRLADRSICLLALLQKKTGREARDTSFCVNLALPFKNTRMSV